MKRAARATTLITASACTLYYLLGKYLTLSGAVVGANRRRNVDDGSRAPRLVMGASARF